MFDSDLFSFDTGCQVDTGCSCPDTGFILHWDSLTILRVIRRQEIMARRRHRSFNASACNPSSRAYGVLTQYPSQNP